MNLNPGIAFFVFFPIEETVWISVAFDTYKQRN